jgi:dihydroorotate dehydrogenase (NAD+) catalytic subunit
MGGIESGRDAADFLRAGASAIAVGTASFRDPAAGTRISAELHAVSGRERDFLPSAAR